MISVHVPKCGGTSFRLVLEDIYGRESLQTWYQDRWLIDKININEGVKVLHGHIHLTDMEKLFDNNPQYEEIPIVTWIRNPVDRIISEYYYLMGVLGEQLEPFEHETPTLKKRLAKSLEEFARFPGNVNVMNQFLSKELIQNSSFLFLGEVEKYNTDVELFFGKINQNPFHNIHHVNVTKDKPLVDKHTWSILTDINSEDVELYEYLKSKKDTINQRGLDAVESL